MASIKKTRVIIVDDSSFMRDFLKRRLSEDPAILVVGTAADPFEARDLLVELQPDVMTLDIHMPKMDGVRFLRQLMPQFPLPVIAVSNQSQRKIEILEAGAADFIEKPIEGDLKAKESFVNQLRLKIKLASVMQVKKNTNAQPNKMPDAPNLENERRIIAIGASTGGTEATLEVLKNLPYSMPGILIVHICRRCLQNLMQKGSTKFVPCK